MYRGAQSVVPIWKLSRGEPGLHMDVRAESLLFISKSDLGAIESVPAVIPGLVDGKNRKKCELDSLRATSTYTTTYSPPKNHIY
jgi:hypothetical protein